MKHAYTRRQFISAHGFLPGWDWSEAQEIHIQSIVWCQRPCRVYCQTMTGHWEKSHTMSFRVCCQTMTGHWERSHTMSFHVCCHTVIGQWTDVYTMYRSIPNFCPQLVTGTTQTRCLYHPRLLPDIDGSLAQLVHSVSFHVYYQPVIGQCRSSSTVPMSIHVCCWIR